MMTPQYGLVVLDLPFSAFRNFGKYAGDLKIYGKSLSEVLTKAVIGKGRSKKFGQFNTIRFEIAGLMNSDGIQKVAALPSAEETPFDVADETEACTTGDAPPPPDDGDFIPY